MDIENQARSHNDFSSVEGEIVPDNGHESFDVVISKDRMACFISLRPGDQTRLSPKIIKEHLKDQGINSGLVADDQDVADYINGETKEAKPFKIAHGKEPRPGRDGVIKYYFNTDPLKIGTIKESGIIDYKDRGEIPHIEKGDLVAEKFPGQKGTPGIDIYGRPVLPREAEDPPLKCGEGCESSPDRLKVYAKIAGRPELSADGKLYVFPDYIVEGDVGVKTGHIRFEGRIEVGGSIKNGYEVKGGSLLTQEILQADIDIIGDITVLGGVVGSRIKTGGNLRARYIHHAVIEAEGDVVVENDLSNSTIKTSGMLIVDQGKILSSSVLSRNGIRAEEIGSEKSNPCSLEIGYIEGLEEQTDLLKQELEENIRLREQSISDRQALKEVLFELEKSIEQNKQNIAVALTQYKQMTLKLEDPVEESNKRLHDNAKQIFQHLNVKITESRQEEQTLLSQYETKNAGIDEIKSNINHYERQIDRLNKKLIDLNRLSKIDQGEFKRNPIVEVLGRIFPHTSISGPHASICTTGLFERVRIKEIKKGDPHDPGPWNMKIMGFD